VKLKDPKDWTIAGQKVKRLDTADKLTGKQIYAVDVKLPGMLNASIMDAPVFGAKVKSYDEAKAKAMPGVRHVLKVGETAVAVVADTWWQANQALKALNIAWEEGPNDKVSSETIAAFLQEGLEAKDGVFVGNKIGDAPPAIDGAAKKLEATFFSPYQNHACMEPMNCTARWTADKCEVWVATQNGMRRSPPRAEAAGLPPAKCEVYKYHLGGGFGRRGSRTTRPRPSSSPSKSRGRRSGWSDPRRGYAARPLPAIGMCKMSADWTTRAELVGLSMRIAAPSILASAAPARLNKDGSDFIAFQGLNPQGPEGQIGYTVPNLLVEHAMRNTHVPPGFWRGVNNNQNAIWLETFIAEVAKAAGKDPLEFRRKMMANHPKHLLCSMRSPTRSAGARPAGRIARGIAR